MTFKEFYQRLTGRYLWGNLLAMMLTLVVVIVGLFVFLHFYTHHGETVAVPDVRGQRAEVAIRKLQALGIALRWWTPATILVNLPTSFSTKTYCQATKSS